MPEITEHKDTSLNSDYTWRKIFLKIHLDIFHWVKFPLLLVIGSHKSCKTLRAQESSNVKRNKFLPKPIWYKGKTLSPLVVDLNKSSTN